MAGTAEKQTGILPVYVIFGKDRRRALEALDKVRAAVLGDADPQVALSVYEEQPDWAEVHDGLVTLPFLSERRLVVVKDADSFISANRQYLEQYLESPSETGVLVLVAESFPKTTRLYKKVQAIGGLIDCEPPKPRELPAFLADYAKNRHGLGLARDAAGLLIELAGDDAGLLANEVDKLAAYVTRPEVAKKQIDADDVQELVGQNRLYSVFDVLDAMTAGREATALEKLEQMLGRDKDAQYKAIGAFAWGVRRLYQARALLEKGTAPGAIIKQLRVWSQQQAFIEQVKRLDLRRIGRMLRELADLDLESKTGGSAVQDGLERWIVRFSRA